MYSNKNIAIFDIESTSIPITGVFGVEYIHCIGIKVNDNPTMMYTSRYLPLHNYGGTLSNALEVLNSVDFIVGHNIIGFDCIVIEQLLGKLTANRLDTLLLAKLLYTREELSEIDLNIQDFPKAQYGSFSLDSFGRRMNEYKGSYSDWSRLTSEMCNYCTQDVEVTYKLFNTLITHSNYPASSVIDLENEVAHIIAQQTYHGFYYNIEGGRELMQKLMHEKLNIELRLAKTFKPMFLSDGNPIVPAGSRRNKIYIENKNYKGF